MLLASVRVHPCCALLETDRPTTTTSKSIKKVFKITNFHLKDSLPDCAFYLSIGTHRTTSHDDYNPTGSIRVTVSHSPPFSSTLRYLRLSIIVAASYRSKMSSITRKTTQAARRMTIAFPLRRTFVSSSSIKKDFVQELYLRELKSYKPSTQSLQGLQTQVRDFTMPAAPAAPEVPSAQDIAQEMQSWDSASLVNNQAPSSDTAEVDVNGQSADEFLAFLERDHPPPAAH
ncbi:hypothetical protein PSTT_02680 [Puccinia striiformis]|uniref:Uncharacterized protein n=2 Tax=Puccinia striiformis TaxID=27350 RepID=A0A2S4VZ16_9BASI|nr:hypothetical protein PSTT_02680 [Puccinia striiformis]